MCDQHLDSPLPDPEPNRGPAPGLDRRQVLKAGAGLLAVAGLRAGGGTLLGGRRAYADTTADGLLAVPMAMHVHGSFSEGTSGVVASWETQLDQAREAGIRVLWPTDHDWRMSAFRAPDVFHTAALQEVVQHRSYTWQPQATGSLATSTAVASAACASPADPALTKGGLRLAATSAGADPASQRLVLDGSSSDHGQKTNIAGQVLRVQVLPSSVGPDAWGELLITLAHHPARAGRPAGSYQLSYRFGPDPAPASTQGLLAIVPVAVSTGQWNEVVLDPVEDIAAAWPDLVAADNSLTDLWLGVTSRGGAPADVVFAYLRFSRSGTDGDTPLAVQSQLLGAYRTQFPEVVVHHGLELSVNDAHTNSFGRTRHLPDYRQGEAAAYVVGDPAAYARWSADLIHGWGGLASLNHVFGSHATAQTPDQQATHRRALAAKLLPARAYGMDLLEVGYRARGGATLGQHLALWDTLSCAGVWLTGSGVNDAHGGPDVSWRTLNNRFSTTVLAASTRQADLLAGLAAGRAYVSELGSSAGLLQVAAGGCPMGAVSVQPGVAQRPLTVSATDLPLGSTVQVVQSPVDFGADLDPKAAVVATLDARAFSTGSSTVVLDTSRSTFARVQVVSAAGQVVAFSNPVWLLQAPPPVPVPLARRSPDSLA